MPLSPNSCLVYDDLIYVSLNIILETYGIRHSVTLNYSRDPATCRGAWKEDPVTIMSLVCFLDITLVLNNFLILCMA